MNSCLYVCQYSRSSSVVADCLATDEALGLGEEDEDDINEGGGDSEEDADDDVEKEEADEEDEEEEEEEMVGGEGVERYSPVKGKRRSDEDVQQPLSRVMSMFHKGVNHAAGGATLG